MKSQHLTLFLLLLTNCEFIKATPTRRLCVESGVPLNEKAQLNQDTSEEYETYYDDNTTEEPTPDKGNASSIAECSKQASFCYTLWMYNATKNATKTVVRQGCWETSDKRESCHNTECVSHTLTDTGHIFCCCSGDNCNANFTFQMNPIATAGLFNSQPGSDITPFAPYTSIWSSPAVYICFAIVGILLMLIIGFMTCHSNSKAESELAPLAPSGPGYSSNLYNVDNLKVVSMIGQGKYGTVWKGIVNEQPVAVKIFTAQHKQYFLNEKDIYSIPLMESPALLTYFGCDERRTLDDRIEFLLVLSIAPLGCLQDWLIENTTDFTVFGRMGKSIARGLSHLHTEIKKGDLLKPCICHRDINSRNILVKPDLTCCICDLGFALKTYGPRYECKGEMTLAETKSINEVGTLRYMAPEVLEGAVNLRDCESALKQIDVYSMGLVLWELCMRCDDFYPTEQTTPPYKAPYEAEIGTNPTFEQMQVLVSRHKARPLFPPSWGGGTVSKIVRDTCEDCWDHDAEARLTALCVEERLQEISTMKPKSYPYRGTSPPLSTNNFIPTTPTSLTNTSPTIASFITPPNQQIIPKSHQFSDLTFETFPNFCTNNTQKLNTTIKNRDIFAHQIQPFQGRNPCQERNLVPQPFTSNNILIEKSQKHNVNRNYNNEDLLNEDVLVDEYITRTTNGHAIIMGEGLPKQNNTETEIKKGKGWNGVRAMLQKKFLKSDLYLPNGCDDKSNLVDHKLTYKVHIDNLTPAISPTNKNIHVNMINNIEKESQQTQQAERPNNLDLSAQTGKFENNIIKLTNENSKFSEDFTNQTFTVIQPTSPNRKLRIVISKSANAVKNLNTSRNSLIDAEDSKFLKRQRSLEVFREVFGPKGSIERLRDPSQRVKTPGDVPPSVRKVRASKTLSLYDDRMMDTSHMANSV